MFTVSSSERGIEGPTGCLSHCAVLPCARRLLVGAEMSPSGACEEVHALAVAVTGVVSSVAKLAVYFWARTVFFVWLMCDSCLLLPLLLLLLLLLSRGNCTIFSCSTRCPADVVACSTLVSPVVSLFPSESPVLRQLQGGPFPSFWLLKRQTKTIESEICCFVARPLCFTLLCCY